MLLSKMADVYTRCILGEVSVLFLRQKAVRELNGRNFQKCHILVMDAETNQLYYLQTPPIL